MLSLWTAGGAGVSLLLDQVSPPACASCDVRVRRGQAFCGGCAATIVRCDRRHATDPAAVGVYGGALAVAIRRLKGGKRSDLATPLGALLGAAILAQWEKVAFDAVVPVPMTPARIVERSYNQAALLARGVANRLALPSCIALRRVGWEGPQRGQNRRVRTHQIRGAFRADARLDGLRLLVVDDVTTTGATLGEARRALMAAGARACSGSAVARAMDVELA